MKAVMYGAGNIGRGFIGQKFYLSGYDTTFIDVNKEVVDLLNERKSPVIEEVRPYRTANDSITLKHESYIVADIDDISICINTGDTYGISRLESRKVTVID